MKTATPYIIIALCLLSFGIGWYIGTPKEAGHDYEAENRALVADRDQHEAAELIHKNRADKAEHAADSLLHLKSKIIIRYEKTDHNIALLSADSNHALLLSNAATDSIWK